MFPHSHSLLDCQTCGQTWCQSCLENLVTHHVAGDICQKCPNCLLYQQVRVDTACDDGEVECTRGDEKRFCKVLLKEMRDDMVGILTLADEVEQKTFKELCVIDKIGLP